MDFAHPSRFWLLLLLLPLAAWSLRGASRRSRGWAALGRSGRPPGDGSWFRLAAIATVVVALAQPRWGRLPGSEPPPGRDLVLAIDVSRSMAARDAVPDRLGLAVEAARDLLHSLEAGDRAAVVAFAGRGVLACPLTENLDAASDALESLRPGEVTPGGTDFGAALSAVADAFDEVDRAEGRAAVVFSDGEDHAEDWGDALERLDEAGVVVHAVAIGDAEASHPIPTPAGPLAYRGESVETRRVDATLIGLADATGGAFVPIGLSPVDLGDLFRERIAPVARERLLARRPPERAERFGPFVLVAILLGLLAARPGLRRRPALGWATLPAAAALAGGIAAGPASETPAGAVEAGRRAYVQGRFGEALADFERAVTLAPGAAIPRFDAAAALFELGRYDEALERYRQARERAGPTLRPKVDYALGNTAVALGDLAGAIAHYDDCIASTAPGADLDAVRRDAAENRQFVLDRAREADEAPSEGGAGARSGGEGEGEQAGAPGDGPHPEGGEPNAPAKVGDSGGGPPPDTTAGPRGAGGAGGTSTDTRARGTPAERLDRALRNAREARRLRLPDPPPPGPQGDRKDW